MKYFQKIPAKFRIGPHPKYILDLLIGNLLGDGSLEYRQNATRFVFSQENTNQEYLHWIHQQYSQSGYCSQKKPHQKIRLGKKNAEKYN